MSEQHAEDQRDLADLLDFVDPVGGRRVAPAAVAPVRSLGAPAPVVPPDQRTIDVSALDAPASPGRRRRDVPVLEPVLPLAEEVPVENPAPEMPAEPEEPEDELTAIRRSAAELSATRLQLAERTIELRRLRDEYVNHRRRVERDEQRLVQDALFSAMEPVVEALDSIDLARRHGDLDEGMRMVATQLERSAAAKGLVRFGDAGDLFDVTCHEAVQNSGTRAGLAHATCEGVLRSGYRVGDRILRPAQVVVVTPEPTA